MRIGSEVDWISNWLWLGLESELGLNWIGFQIGSELDWNPNWLWIGLESALALNCIGFQIGSDLDWNPNLLRLGLESELALNWIVIRIGCELDWRVNWLCVSKPYTGPVAKSVSSALSASGSSQSSWLKHQRYICFNSSSLHSKQLIPTYYLSPASSSPAFSGTLCRKTTLQPPLKCNSIFRSDHPLPISSKCSKGV